MLLSLIRSGADISEILIQLLLTLPIVIFSLSLHECAHGWMAKKCGDNTAYNLGRLTLDPLKHLDPIGSLCMLLFGIGWAKPVPINSRNFKKPRRDTALTAAAGPVSNLIFALVCLLLYQIYLKVYVVLNPEGTLEYGSIAYVIALFLFLASEMNVYLAVFNLLPIPPFDGSRIFYIFLPAKWYFGIMKYERYIQIAIIIALYTGFITGPISALSNLIFQGMLYLLNLIPFLSV